MRLSVSLQEIPASTRMLALELERTVEFPRLPLARTVMRIAILDAAYLRWVFEGE
jgi:hypothetical protein